MVSSEDMFMYLVITCNLFMDGICLVKLENCWLIIMIFNKGFDRCPIIIIIVMSMIKFLTFLVIMAVCALAIKTSDH
jgi:hypothetical protein